MENKETVCAVVVTYNRKDLLMECLEALRQQTRPIDSIYLIDNASTDNTPELLMEKEYINELPPVELNEPWEKEFKIDNIPLHYVRMNKNTGGAGGFYEGVKRGYEKGYDWLWLMDDDTITTFSSLTCMFEKLDFLSNMKIGFLSSKVLYVDETPHIMNIPTIKSLCNGIPFNIHENKGVLLIESSSFVSLLVNRKVVSQVGLPIKDFFIWGDDVEWTLRISHTGLLGIYVRDSIVYHKTQKNYSASSVYDSRFYYNVRNSLWITRLHRKWRYPFYLLKTLLLTFKLPSKVWMMNVMASISSLLKFPKIKYPK